MKKYYIGIIVICLCALGLAGYTAYIGVQSKQDVQTEKKAREIAEKLNRYVDTEKKIPESLNEVGVSDAPESISYEKLSDATYKFCQTYKADSTYDYNGLTGTLVGGAINGGISAYPDDYDYYASQNPESLYIDGTHKKGENCQTIEPYLGGSKYDDYYDDYPVQPQGSSSNDSKRQTDINSIHSQLELYFAFNGFYPTLDNVNDAAWRAENMKNLDSDALTDPEGTEQLVASPKKGAYSYEVQPEGCDNSATSKCSSYVLTATYDNGEVFSKKALN